MEKPCHIASKKDTQGLAHFLANNGQALLPIVDLIEQSQIALDKLIDVVGRAPIEAILRLSAERVAGPPHPGEERRGDRLARAGARASVPERKEVTSGAAATAEEGRRPRR